MLQFPENTSIINSAENLVYIIIIKWRARFMSNTTTSNPAGMRIAALLDSGSFVEIGALVTARSTDFNMAENKDVKR